MGKKKNEQTSKKTTIGFLQKGRRLIFLLLLMMNLNESIQQDMFSS